ncbi:MAG: glycosyltransferase family 4 protein [bacterium]|nr:glycosyltransferase family 4 protein [bacterium]
MKIALVCPYDMGHFGGVQNQVGLIAASLRSRRHDAWIVAPGESDQPMRSLGKSRSWSFNGSNTPIKLSPSVVARLRAAVAEADVVHVHEPLMPMVSMATRWANRPLVGTFHADPARWTRFLYRRFPPLKWHLSRFSSLAAVSDTARSAVAGFGDVVVVPNGVATRGLPEPNPVLQRIVFVGRNDPRKGLDIATAALSELRTTHPDAHLVVVSPDKVAAQEGVDLRRNVDDATKQRILATAEIFIAPNRRGESFGLTVAEGMAAGAACVVSDIPAFRAVVGSAALRAEPGDPASFASAIRSLFDDPARSRQLGVAARDRVRTLSIERTVDAYLPMYLDAMKGR